jgi:hypothetical protein
MRWSYPLFQQLRRLITRVVGSLTDLKGIKVFERPRHEQLPDSSIEPTIHRSICSVRAYSAISALELRRLGACKDALPGGLTKKEIADELRLTKSTVCHHTKRARAEGRISDGH